MGMGMFRNLLKVHPVFVYNRTTSKINEAIGDRKGKVVKCISPFEVGKQSDIVLLCVSDAPDVEHVLCHKETGVIEGMKSSFALESSTVFPETKKEKIIIDCSTSSISLAKKLDEICKGIGRIGILDAPISGGPEGANNGTLSIMCGGEKDVFDASLPILNILGKNIVHVGAAGSGQITKAVNQLCICLHYQAAAEGVMLAKKSGVDPNLVIDAIKNGAAGSWVLQNRADRMIKEDFTNPNFTLSLQMKDLRIVREHMKEVNVDLPFTTKLTNNIEELLETKFEEKPLSELDSSSIYVDTYNRNK
ncbi:hypothetical protein SNEBB_002868 [Seison nebaliae]|nr:hypothetical protein SNEBB_002868 [Seison nebaliae]